MKPIAAKAAAALCSIFLCGAASAQAEDAQETYLAYQEAIQAAETCYGLEFDQSEHDALNVAVMQEIGVPISPGIKLRLIEEAKDTVRRAAGFGSPDCTRPLLSGMLGLYRQDLAEIVPIPEE